MGLNVLVLLTVGAVVGPSARLRRVCGVRRRLEVATRDPGLSLSATAAARARGMEKEQNNTQNISNSL